MRLTPHILQHSQRVSFFQSLRALVQEKCTTHRDAILLAQRFGWIIFSIGIAIILLETIEHASRRWGFSAYFFSETLFIALVVILTVYLIRELMVSIAEKTRAMTTLRLQHALSVHVSASEDLNDLSRRLLQQISAIVPSYGLELYFYHPEKGCLTITADLPLHNPALDQPTTRRDLDLSPCRLCLKNHPGDHRDGVRPIRECYQTGLAASCQVRPGYCLPLLQNGEPVGMLHLYNPPHQDLSGEQMELLANLSFEISNALYTTIQKKAREAELLSQKIRTVQLDIARDLHDTIGQNISYLRMKLEHLADSDLETRAQLAAEVHHMLQVANESYDQMRGTLSVLQSSESVDLGFLFTRYTNQIQERLLFQVEYIHQGIPRPLSPDITRQLFYVFREALNNIEKYAGATHVWVTIDWGAEGLNLSIADNGVGFTPVLVHARGSYGDHYGLKFMRERIERLNGTLSIQTLPNSGACVSAHVPYDNPLVSLEQVPTHI